MSRRRSRTPAVTVIFWRDIPAQVTATTDGTTDGRDTKIMLHPRFQNAIDRAAHVAGLTETHDYIEQWRRVTTAVSSDAMTEAQTAAERVQTEYHPQRLEALVKSGGLEPTTDPTPTTGPTTSDKENAAP